MVSVGTTNMYSGKYQRQEKMTDLGIVMQCSSTKQGASFDGKRQSEPSSLLDEADRESDVTLPSYTEMCGDEESLWSYEESVATLSYYTEMSGGEHSVCDESNKSGVTLPSYTEMCGDEQSVCHESETSGITLPSYSEMCGDEESLFENGGVHLPDNTESNEEMDIHEEGRLTLPGCSGDYVKENFLNLKDMKNYRYIGKKRVNLNEFENPATRWIDKEPHVPRTPPAESTAFGVKKLVNRWLKQSEDKAEAVIPDLRFYYESDVRQSCPGILPRLSSSGIAISSSDHSSRKRRRDQSEHEVVLGSRSETDIFRPQPRRVNKRRKISCR